MAASRQSRRLADLIDRETRKLELPGVRRATAISRSMRAASLRAFVAGQDPISEITARLTREFAPLVKDALVTAHLFGRRRVAIHQAAQQGAGPGAALAIGSTYEEAASFVTARLGLTEQELAFLEALYGDAAVRVTRTAGTRIEEKVSLASAQSVVEGLTQREGVKRLRRAFGAAGVSQVDPHLLETLFRTQVNLAYNAGRVNAAQDPAIDEILWGWEYVTVGDDRVRPNHATLDGTRLPKDDPRWAVITPPNGFNCRCSIIEIFKDDKRLATVKEPKESLDVETLDRGVVTGRPVPDRGFEFNPGTVFRDTVSAPIGPVAAPPAPVIRPPRRPVVPARRRARTTAELREELRQSREKTARARKELEATQRRIAKKKGELEESRRALDAARASNVTSQGQINKLLQQIQVVEDFIRKEDASIRRIERREG